MSTAVEEVKDLIVKQGQEWQKFQEKSQTRIDDIEEHLKAMNRPNLGGSLFDSKSELVGGQQFIDTKTGRPVPVLSHNDRLTALDRKSAGSGGMPDGSVNIPSMGRLMRGIVLGGRAKDAEELAEERKSMSIGMDPSGGYTVNGILASMWIDALRSKMVLSQAGALTLPMESGQVSIARVTGDPVISWHGENQALPDTEATLGSITLNAKTCVCLVKLSLELSQDSANIEQILEQTISQAMAAAIDSSGLNGVLPAPGGVMNLEGRNSVTGIGAPASYDFLIDGIAELLVDNVAMEDIGAFIAHPLVWKKLAKLRTGITNDETPLVPIAEIAKIPKLWTTAAPLVGGTTAAGVIGNWRDLIFGVRKDITIRVLSEAFMGSNLQLAVLAYARVDFAATRRQSFCTLEGITV